VQRVDADIRTRGGGDPDQLDQRGHRPRPYHAPVRLEHRPAGEHAHVVQAQAGDRVEVTPDAVGDTRGVEVQPDVPPVPARGVVGTEAHAIVLAAQFGAALACGRGDGRADDAGLVLQRRRYRPGAQLDEREETVAP